MQAQHFLIKPVPPFRLDLTAWALRRRAHNLVDRWDGERYRRAIALGHARPLEVAIKQIAPLERPRLEVTVTGGPLDDKTKRALKTTLDRLFGFHIDLRPFYALAEKDRRLSPLVERFRGLKPPRYPTLFEGLVNGIACQQISLDVGITLLNRLAQRFGAKGENAPAFPGPGELAGQDPAQLRSLGFSGHKVQAVLELAGEAHAGRVDLEALSTLGNEEAVKRLLQLRGVGRWTAEYLLLRGMGRLEIFPGDDAGARRRLAQWIKGSEPLDYEGVGLAVRGWWPYAGVIYFHLLLNGLAVNGLLAEKSL
jgi:DNA-3-methyladenine glycosylase II